MTAVAAPSLVSSLKRREITFWGSIAGIIGIFVSAIGMVEVFDTRSVIDPILSLGYMALLWIPILLGYRVSYEPVLEGMPAPVKGAHNVVAGALTGFWGGVFVAGFVVLADAVNLRDVLLNVTPRLIEILTFDTSIGAGVVLIIFSSTALGAGGGAFHLVSDRWRKALTSAFLWILIIGFLELVLGNVLKEIGLRSLDDLTYSPNRGITIGAAIVIAAAVLFLRIRFEGRAAVVRSRYLAKPEKERKRTGFLVAIALVGVGLVIPSVFGPFLNEVLATVGLFMLMGLGLNIVVGFAGLLDLGYVAFFAVGAYTTAVLTSPITPSGFTPELAFYAALPFVIVMAIVAGIIVGTPVIRMRGDYLAIVTLAFGEIARLVFQADWLKDTFGGAQGILRIGEGMIRTFFGFVIVAVGLIALVIGFLRWRAAQENGGRQTAAWVLMIGGAVATGFGLIFPDFATWTVLGIDSEAVFRLVLVFVVLAAFVSWRLEDSRVGRAWMAMREDEHVAESMGINIVTAKLLAFIIGAILASLGGAIFAVKIGTIFPSSFKIVQSIIILVLVIVGGMGSLRGVAVGALVLIGVLGGPTQPGMLREFQEFKLLIYGVLLVYMMLQRPEGLVPSARRTRELHQDEFLQDAWFDGADDEGEDA